MKRIKASDFLGPDKNINPEDNQAGSSGSGIAKSQKRIKSSEQYPQEPKEPIERIRKKIPGISGTGIRIFDVTPKQEMFCTNLSKLDYEIWRDPESWIYSNSPVAQAAVEAGFTKEGLTQLRRKQKIIELAKAKYFKEPYRVNTKGKASLSPDGQSSIWTIQQERFCQEFASDPMRDVRMAAERAQYSKPEYGYRVIKNPRIQKRIQEIIKERKLKFQPSINNLLQRLFIEANVNMADYIDEYNDNNIKFRDSRKLTRDHMAGIKEIKRTEKQFGKTKQTSMNLKLRDSHKAQKLLFEFFGLGSDGNNDNPRDFVQSVISFSKDVNMADAFPMEQIPSIEKIEEAITDDKGRIKTDKIIPNIPADITERELKSAPRSQAWDNGLNMQVPEEPVPY